MNPVPENDIRLIFNTLPGLYLILAPYFTIVATECNDDCKGSDPWPWYI